MSNFKVGDRVRILSEKGEYRHCFAKGSEGVVVGTAYAGGDATVEQGENRQFIPADELELVEDDVIRVGDYVVNEGDITDDVPLGFVAKVRAVCEELGATYLCFSDEAGDSRYRLDISYRKVTLASLYADEEAYHAMRAEADYENYYRDAHSVRNSYLWHSEPQFFEFSQASDPTSFIPYDRGEDPLGDLTGVTLTDEPPTYSEGYGLSDVKSAGDILREAADIVDGQRNKTHGVRERSFQAIADFWNVYLSHRTVGDEYGHEIVGQLTDVDVAEMMVLLKVARQLTGEPHPDHYVDQAGYAGVAGELAARL